MIFVVRWLLILGFLFENHVYHNYNYSIVKPITQFICFIVYGILEIYED